MPIQALMCHETQGATSHLTATFQGPSIRKNWGSQQMKDGSQEATLASISSHLANNSCSTAAPTQAPSFPASLEPALLCGLTPNRCRSLRSHDLVPCVCLRGCHGANCSVYSSSPNARCSVGICSNGSWCLVLLDFLLWRWELGVGGYISL